MDQAADHQVEGRRAVLEALRSGRTPDKLFVFKGAEGISQLVQDAKKAGAVIVECDRARLDGMSRSKNHQGVIGRFTELAYVTPEDILQRAKDKGEPPFLVICDGVEDEGNLGAIIRSAEAAGAHGLILTKRRSASLSPVTIKTSAGAAEHLPVARVPGIPAALRWLKEQNVWIYGADAAGSKLVYEQDFSGACAIVVGSEGHGLSRLTAESCDFLVKIPMRGQVSSLNVSAAAAILLFAAAQGR